MAGYITAEEADTVIAGLMLSADARRAAWEALTAADKEICLEQALLRIEAVPYRGRKAAEGQTLQFPRAGQDGVPAAVKLAQAMEACAGLGMAEEAAKRAQLRAQGIRSFSAGKLSETYDSGGTGALGTLYSAEAQRLLKPFVLGVAPIA